MSKWFYNESKRIGGKQLSQGGEMDKVTQGDGENGYLITTGRNEHGSDEAPLIEYDRNKYRIERDAASTEQREIFRIVKR